MPSHRDAGFVEQVLQVVEQVPAGRVTTYGTIGEALGAGPRQIGAIMALHGGGVCWWRVVRADGSLPDSHRSQARARYDDERTPILASGRIDMRSAYWQPGDGPGGRSRGAQPSEATAAS